MLYGRKIKFSNENILLSLVILFFVLIVVLLPVYDAENGFYNIIFGDYKLTWYDGRSPADFHIIKNLIEKGSSSFPKGCMIGNMLVEDMYDFIEKDSIFYPGYPILSDYIYATILYFIPFSSDLQLFKEMICLTIIFSAIMLIIFYKVQRLLGLTLKYSLMSTLIGGLATSILIYSKYLFMHHTISSLLLISLIYFLLSNLKKPSKKNEIIISINFALFLIFIYVEYIILIFFIILSYFFIKYKIIRSKKTIFFAAVIVLIFYPLSFIAQSPIESYTLIPGVSFFRAFPDYINALDFSVYGYHDVTSTWKLERKFAYTYAFEEPKGNAIFLKFYGLFGSLFGSKGIIYNSLFLIFSILGIFIYERKRERNLMLILLILIIITYGFANPLWYGGFTPRYDKFFAVPALILTFFSFHYIQEVFKEKNKIIRFAIYVIFIVLVILSTLNIASISIRTDWNYEHEADLVSYDLVLWPWYPSISQGNVINLYLTEQGESIEWKFGGEIENCNSYGNLEGVHTSICGCGFSSYAQRNINIPWEKIRINFTICNKNNDSSIGVFYFDENEKEIIIQPNVCKEESILVENSNGKHNLILKVKNYKECKDETIIWKLITIEKI